MDLLYPDIINYIGGFLCDSDLSNVSQTCKKHSETLFKTLQKRKRDKIERIRKTFPDWLIELVSIEKFITMPCLEWRKEWLGHTDYIDSIKRGVSKLPMWYTIDQYRRSAIIVDVKAVVYYDDGRTKEVEVSICIFQRYTNGAGYICGTPYSGVAIEILNRAGMLNPSNSDLLLQLVKYGEVDYIHNKNNYFNIDVDRIVFTIG